MTGQDQRRSRQEKKSEPGFRQSRRVPSSSSTAASTSTLSSSSSSFQLLQIQAQQPPPHPPSQPIAIHPQGRPGHGPVLNGLCYGPQHHSNPHVNCNFTCCPPLPLSPNSHHHHHHQHHHHHSIAAIASSNTVHHFGEAQIPSVASICNRPLEFRQGRGGESGTHQQQQHQQHHQQQHRNWINSNGHGDLQQVIGSSELGSRKCAAVPPLPPVHGYVFPQPPNQCRGKFVGPGCESRQQPQAHQIVFHHPVQQFQQHSTPHPQQVFKGGYQTVNLSNLTGINHVGSNSNNISLNYVLNENTKHHVTPIVIKQGPSLSKLVNIEQQPTPQAKLYSPPKSTIPEISIRAVNHAPAPDNAPHSSNNGNTNNSGHKQLRESCAEIIVASISSASSTSDTVPTSSQQQLSGETGPSPSRYPCGPEVLHSIQQQKHSIQREITCEPLKLNPDGSTKSVFPSHVIVTQPEITITRSTRPIDDNVDLSKLNYLSRLACEVGKLELGSTRQQRVEEILTRNPNLRTPDPPEEEQSIVNRESDSPIIILTAINGQSVTDSTNGKPMGVFHTMTNGTGESIATGVRIKQESMDHYRQHEETGDEVLDLRKPSTEKLCIWCSKNPTLVENGIESDFCTELCFHMYRRDSFKKRSNCIWCSGTSPEKHSGGLVDESRFCSEECLNKYKVKLFCEETSAHLEQLKGFQLNGTNPVIPNSRLSNMPKGNASSNRGSATVPSGHELITPDLWTKKHINSNQDKKWSADAPSTDTSASKVSPELRIDPSRSSSGTPSPSTDSLHSIHSHHSNSNSLSPNQPIIPQHGQPNLQDQNLIMKEGVLSQGQRVQQHPLKGRLHPAFMENPPSCSEKGGRRRAKSPILEQRDCSYRGIGHGQRSPRSSHNNNYGCSGNNLPAPRKKMKSSSASATNTSMHGGNFLHMDLPPRHNPQDGLGSLPLNISMLQMAAFSAMQGINFNSAGASLPPCMPHPSGGNMHSEHKSSRNKNAMMNSGGMMNHMNNSNLLSGGMPDINLNSEMGRSLMMNGQQSQMPGSPHLHHSRPHPSTIVMQQHGQGSGTSITHSGLHAGGLMMSSPNIKQSGAASSISKLQLSSLGLSPSSLLEISSFPRSQQPPVAETGESFTTASANSSNGYITPEGLRSSNMICSPSNSNTLNHPNGLSLTSGSDGSGTLSLNLDPQQQRERQMSGSTSSPSPVSTCTSCTQTDPDETKKEPEQEGTSPKAKMGTFGGNEFSSHFFSALPPVTLLIPYPIPIPVPVPMPFFFPSNINNLTSIKLEERAEHNNTNTNEQRNDSSGEKVDPPPPMNVKQDGESSLEKISHEEDYDAHLHNEEVQAAIEMSLQEVVLEIEIGPEEMELDGGDDEQCLHNDSSEDDPQIQQNDVVVVDKKEKANKLFLESGGDNGMNSSQENESVIGGEREEIIRREVEMVNHDNENSQKPTPTDFNNAAATTSNSSIQVPTGVKLGEVDVAEVMKREEPAQQRMDD